ICYGWNGYVRVVLMSIASWRGRHADPPRPRLGTGGRTADFCPAHGCDLRGHEWFPRRGQCRGYGDLHALAHPDASRGVVRVPELPGRTAGRHRGRLRTRGAAAGRGALASRRRTRGRNVDRAVRGCSRLEYRHVVVWAAQFELPLSDWCIDRRGAGECGGALTEP